MRFDAGRRPTTPDEVEQRAHEWFDQVDDLVGDRLAERRYDDDRGLRVTIVDLTDDDVTTITQRAAELGIAAWVRIERADPGDLANWERLRHDLLRLEDAEPKVLEQWSTPDPGYRRPPVRLVLAASAERTAADLHERYGDFVSLRVGALPYPPQPGRPGRAPRSSNLDSLDPAEVRVVLDGPLRLRTGETTTHGLIVTNLGVDEIGVHTNGHVTASVVDASGTVMGGFTGFEASPLVIFTIAPAASVRIPVLVATNSFDSDLGYAVPPGEWHLVAPLQLADGRELLTPPLELTITG